MSIPTSFSVDIVGKEVLKFEAVVEVLKIVEEKDNLFTNFPMGTTIQDGGKRKRSDDLTLLILPYFEIFSNINII